MLTVLFWNLNGLDRAPLCAALAHAHAATVFVAAECPRPGAILAALNPPGRPARYHLLPNPVGTRIEVFTTLPPTEWQGITTTRHYSVHGLVRVGTPELLLCAAHLPSQLIPSDRDQEETLGGLARALAGVEDQRGHARTLLVGDLNADPFHYGVYSAAGLHAVPTRQLAGQEKRTVGGREVRFFYNPMWRFFGDATPGPPGTYFWRQARPDCRFWYIVDQVFLRPALIEYFADADLHILTGHGPVSFESTRDGRPNKAVASDHFPILLRLDYPGV